MTDTVVSFKIAKLAKEKGFDVNVMDCYYKDKTFVPGTMFNNSWLANYNIDDDRYSAPTQSLLRDWMWKKHKIWVEVTLWGDGIGFICTIKQVNGKEDDGSTIVRLVKFTRDIQPSNDPSKSLELGLQNALEAIKN